MGRFIVSGGGTTGTPTPPLSFGIGLTQTGLIVDLDPAEVQGDPVSEIGGVYEVPADGQQYARQYVAGVPTWVPVTSGGVWVGPNPPALVPPATTWTAGTLWWRTDPDADLYLWYPDAGGPGQGAWVRAAQPLYGTTTTSVFIGPSPPPNAVPGTLWQRNDPDFDLYILHLDGAWVRAAKPLL